MTSLRESDSARESTVIGSPESPFALRKSFIRPVFFNCLTLVVILTLCLYGLGVVGLYLHWFVLEATPTETPTPIIVTVIMTAEPGSNQEPIIITVVATRPPDNSRPPTATLEPTPTQWWPPATPTEEPAPTVSGAGETDAPPDGSAETTPSPPETADFAGISLSRSGASTTTASPGALPFFPPQPEGLATPPF